MIPRVSEYEELPALVMTDRVARLREQSRSATPTLSTERAELLTAFYRQNRELLSEPVRRALAFRHLMEHNGKARAKSPNFC